MGVPVQEDAGQVELPPIIPPSADEQSKCTTDKNEAMDEGPEAESEEEEEEEATQPDEPIVPTAMGGDVPVGGFFNRTRMMMRNESKFATMQQGFRSSSMKQQNNLDGSLPTAAAGFARPAPMGDDYLASLLPGSGFQAEETPRLMMPGSRFDNAPSAATAGDRSSAGCGRGPDSALNGTTRNSKLQSLPPVSENGVTRTSAGLAAMRLGSLKEAVPNAVDDNELGELASGDDDLGIMATWHFEQVTADGGVALAFDDLEKALDDSSNLDQLHQAIESLIEDQQGSAAVLEESVAAELAALAALHSTLRRPDTEEDDSEAVQQLVDVTLPRPVSPLPTVSEESDAAVETHGAVAEPASEPASAAQVAADTPGVQPAEAATVEPAAKGRLPAVSGTPQAVQKDAEQPDVKEGRSSRNASHAQAAKAERRTPSQQASVKAHLTATINLGFKTGHFKKLNFAILVVGTRGDVQPFVGIGLKLQSYGHRVRIASHAVYREFVTGFGLEFYPLGGDPKVLSEFVVKHRGINPGFNIKDALQQREQVREILYSTWGACTAADPKRPDKPFVADAIVANPPAYGHIHCAEALNVPLHVVFTMPWTPTKAFPQPFARIKTNMQGNNSKARELMNYLSYFAMEDLAWLGMASMQKDFRQRVLGLNTWNKYTTSHAIGNCQVPITYIWSPSLVGRPTDWPAYCEVVGFCNVELRKLSSYEAPQDLKDFLASGPPPVYIGFGSLVVDKPKALTRQFLAALEHTGLRAIIQRGWGGLGSEYGVQPDGKPGKQSPANVLFIDSAPHDWLFQCVCAVIHHGGAGTTATGLMAGKPTFIVPFFGDQPFWGAACERAGVGPAPVPIDNLTVELIVDALKELILPTRQKAATELAARMAREDGISVAVDHIHRTVYSALLGKKTPIWMKSNQPSGGATSTIQEMETGEGDGILRGVFRLPGGKPGTQVPASRAGSLSGRSASSLAAGNQKCRSQAVEIVDTGGGRLCAWSFLGC